MNLILTFVYIRILCFSFIYCFSTASKKFFVTRIISSSEQKTVNIFREVKGSLVPLCLLIE